MILFKAADLVSRSASSSGPVNVVLIMVGAAVVDDQDQLFDVQASCCYRGGHHKAASAILEIVDDAVSVVLVDP